MDIFQSKQKLIAPSLLSADFSRLGEEVAAVEKAGADLLHLDIMDGHFVPNLTMGPMLVAAIRKLTKLKLDTHLMIENPEKLVNEFIKAGSDMISVHVEAVHDLPGLLRHIKSQGVGCGVVLNPPTPVKHIETALPLVDYVLVMTVNPGFGGQAFIAEALPKINELVKLREQQHLKFKIEVDGGINASTIAEASRAGCDIFVAGSAIFKSTSYAQTIQQLRSLL